jgi:hypothetical protein
MQSLFREVGFIVEVIDETRWSQLPIPRNKMAIEFRNRSESDLLVSTSHLVLRKPNR